MSDGWKPSAETIALTHCDREPSGIHPEWGILRPIEGIRLTQAVKHRHGRRLERGEVRALIGEPVDPPYPVHRERLDGTRRDRLGCLTRKTHAFAKDVATADALFSMALFEHNWPRPHRALRRPLPQPVASRRYEQRSPALALGLTGASLVLARIPVLPVMAVGEIKTERRPHGRQRKPAWAKCVSKANARSTPRWRIRAKLT